jgi:hypothetical protein
MAEPLDDMIDAAAQALRLKPLAGVADLLNSIENILRELA